MPDRGKVIKGLEVCRDQDNPPGYRFTGCKDDCPYYGNGCAKKLKEDAMDQLKEQPEIVRCKDCKYFDVIKWTEFHRRIWPEDGPECYSCLNPRCNCEEVLPTRGPDWYCADGERKEG